MHELIKKVTQEIESCKIVALGRMIVVRLTTKGEKIPETSSKILLDPAMLNTQLPEGIVVSVGPKSDFGIKEGDYIYFEPNGVRKIPEQNPRFALILDEYIYAKEKE